MPLAFSNCSPSSLRITATLARLISLNEVSIAIEFFENISRSAIFARMRVMGTRSSARAPAARAGPEAEGWGLAGVAGFPSQLGRASCRQGECGDVVEIVGEQR